MSTSSTVSKLTRNQVLGFWAAWAGWALDGMDSFIYALVLVPALRDLLPRSGIAANTANTGFYGGMLFAIFLIGWGCAFLWGPFGDRFGRVRTLTLTILCYSLFTFLGCISTNVWELALFRLLAGVGIGGEWTLGGVFVAEEWPEDRRKWGAAFMHTGYYFGTMLAALVNYGIGTRYGWRAVFAVGGAPALLVAFIRYGVREPKRWQARMDQLGARWTAKQSFLVLFSPEYRKRTIINAAFVFVSMVGLWAGSVYVPASIAEMAARLGISPAEAAPYGSFATMLLSAGTIFGCLLLVPTAEMMGRRTALGFYFTQMLFGITIGFGALFYMGSLADFMIVLFFLGVGGASFAVYTLWLPEQYPTECRGSAFAFATSIGRFLAAGVTFLVGAGVARSGTIGMPVAYTSFAFAAGLMLLPFAMETKGKPLPD